MTDTDLLLKLIADKGYKLKYVAEYLGLSPYGLSNKIKNKQEFKTSEVAALCDLLDIETPEDMMRIFFVMKDD